MFRQLGLVGLFAMVLTATAEGAAPKVSLFSKIIAVGGGQSSASTTFKIKIEGTIAAEQTCAKDLQVSDGGTPDPPKVVLLFKSTDLESAPASLVCLITTSVTGLPYNTSQPRTLSVAWDGAITTFEYTLTNKIDTPFTWTLKTPATQRLTGDEPIAISVLVGERPVTNVKLAMVSLLEQSRKTNLASGGFRLCKNAAGTCEPVTSITAADPSTMWLKSDGKRADAGHFVGTVLLTCREKPEGESVVLDLYETTVCAWFWGGLAIFVGVVGAWLISTWARGRFNRDQLMVPVLALREHLEEIEATLAQAPTAVSAILTRTRAEVDSLEEALSDQSLAKNNLVPVVATPVFAGSAANLVDFRAFIDKTDQRIAVLSAVVKDGLSVAWDQLASNSAANAQQAVTDAIRTIDALVVVGGPAPALSSVVGGIAAALQTLAAGLAALQVNSRSGARPLAATPSATEYQRLTLEMRTISHLAWAFNLIVTTLVGIFALVLPNLGFGIVTDYFACVLWGFGIPLGLQQLSQLNSNSVATTLGLSVAK
jgi:hypothetical protein